MHPRAPGRISFWSLLLLGRGREVRALPRQRVAGHVSGNPSQPPAIQSALNPEGSVQTNPNNEDAAEEHHEIADAKQSQLSLVCQKGKLRFGRRSMPHRACRT